MTKETNSAASTLNHVDPANSPLIASEAVSGGQELSSSSRLLSSLAVSEGLTAVLNRNAEADTVRLTHKVAVENAIADYLAIQIEGETVTADNKSLSDKLETATAAISHTLASAILANAMDRKEARQKMGFTFGFEASKSTGKPTSKPSEPGNTIAKRVSSVTIAAEFAMTGTLPDKGGNSLPEVGQDKVQELLGDYFGGHITVRQASERIEQAIKDVRVTVPFELDADKILALAGKIRTAEDTIAVSEELAEAYAALLQVIASVPFSISE